MHKMLFCAGMSRGVKPGMNAAVPIGNTLGARSKVPLRFFIPVPVHATDTAGAVQAPGKGGEEIIST